MDHAVEASALKPIYTAVNATACMSVARYGVVHHFKGATKEQYEASIAAVHPADGSLPAGQTFHAGGPSADGWIIIACQ